MNFSLYQLVKIQFRVLAILSLLLVTTVVYSQTRLDKRVSVYVNDIPISSILKQIQKESNIFFSYSPNLIPSSEKATIKAYNRSIKDILTTLFLNYNIEFRELGDNVVIYKAKGSASIFKPDLPSIVHDISPKTKDTDIELPKSKNVEIESQMNSSGGNLGKLETSEKEIEGETHVIGLRSDPEPVMIDSLPIHNKGSLIIELVEIKRDSIKEKRKTDVILDIINTYTLFPFGKNKSGVYNEFSLDQKLNQFEITGANVSLRRGKIGLTIGAQFSKHSDSLYTSIKEDASYEYYQVYNMDSVFSIRRGEITTQYFKDSIAITVVDSVDQAYNHRNVFKYFEMPLGLEYLVIDGLHISWSLTALWTNSFLIGSPSQNISESEPVQDLYNQISRKHVSSLGGTSMLIIHFDKRVSVKLGLSYRHAFSPFGKGDYNPHQKRYFLGAGFGIQYMLTDN
ncbi:MAG: STN domain-containing protein [Flavobacteriales bacterium]|nr:STN domain-containing protein [Flavobacteriales bacterium]